MEIMENTEKNRKKSKFAINKKIIVSEESALPQVLMLLTRYGIDIESIEDDDEREKQERQCQEILNRVMSGELEIYEEDNEIKVKQNIQNRNPDGNVDSIVYGEIKGSHRDTYKLEKDDNGFVAMRMLLTKLAETNGADGILKKLRSSDLRTAELLATFFL